MKPLTDEQLRFYAGNGYLLCENWWPAEAITALRAELPSVYAEDSDRRVLEKNGAAVRSIYGSHATHATFANLVRDPRLLGAATQILGEGVYIHQFKLNAKAAFVGDVWQWHQDYVFWREEDGMPGPECITIALFLDDVNEFNGPMLVIPGSHRHGVLSGTVVGQRAAGYEESPAWINNLTADLKYTIDRQTIAALSERRGIVALKGGAGTVMMFHPNLVHASGPNMSPIDRNLALATYNSVANRLDARPNPRPDFLACRNYEPLEPIEEAVAGLAGQTV